MDEVFDDVNFYLADFESRLNKLPKNSYYLSYSGGRDSERLRVLIKHFKRYDIEIVSCNTYMEHAEILERMKRNAGRILYPELKPFKIKEQYGIPCFSKMQDDYIDRYQRGCRSQYLIDRINGFDDRGRSRYHLNKTAKRLLLSGELHRVSPYCCTFMKKRPLESYGRESGKKGIIGVRGNEGILRQSYKSCFTKNGVFTPFYDLSIDMANQIDRYFKIDIPSVYNSVSRTGCMGCPYGSWKGETKKELSLISDSQRKFVFSFFKESYEVLKISSNYQLSIFDK